jgi:hypothetical protein
LPGLCLYSHPQGGVMLILRLSLLGGLRLPKLATFYQLGRSGREG